MGLFDWLKRRPPKGEEEIREPVNSNVFDLHFAYQERIEAAYRAREKNPRALGLAIEACEKQIELAPDSAKAFKREYPGEELPAHVGFQQLAIIREKQGGYTEVIRLCETAKAQGWAGTWEKRIARCKKKLSKKADEK